MKKQFINPDPDGHFRLLPCGCGSDNVGYEQSIGGMWQVMCL